eukprot:2195121-Rhodomonas_salina.1
MTAGELNCGSPECGAPVGTDIDSCEGIQDLGKGAVGMVPACQCVGACPSPSSCFGRAGPVSAILCSGEAPRSRDVEVNRVGRSEWEFRVPEAEGATPEGSPSG